MSKRPVIGCTMSTSARGTGSWWMSSNLNRSYSEWVVHAGGLPIGFPNPDPSLVDAYLATIDGLLLTGGEDVQPLLYGVEPEPGLGEIDVPRDAFELPLARAALAAGLPVLGICRGLQTLCAALGGTLIQDLKALSDRAQHQMSQVGGRTVHHTVRLAPGSRLARIIGAEQVATNSYHHQAVLAPPPGMRVTAWASDGTPEGLETEDEAHFVVGVQWHPEVMDYGHAPTEQLFAAFIAACQGR